jgi:PAS domain S-box-containing protein
MDVTMKAAFRMDPAVSAAVILTIAGPALRVVAATGRLGAETAGLVTELARLPEKVRAALQPDGYVLVSGAAAAEAIDVLRLPPHAAVAVAPMSADEVVFGMLVLAFDRPPADDLSESITTLVARAAITLDQLLSRSRLSIVVEHLADALILAGEAGSIRFVSPAAAELLGCRSSDLLGRNLWSLMNDDDAAKLLAAELAPGPSVAVPCRIRSGDDAEWADVEATMKYVTEHDGSRSIVFTARDVSERQRLELELRHAQKLESVGRLAAGIAHEINTPIQFVGDNLRFLDSAVADLDRMCAAYRELVAARSEPGAAEAARLKIDEVAAEIDLEFVLEEAPAAVAQALEGIGRVANIVRAMKAFGQIGTEEKSRADLNEAIGNTLVVAANEIKYVADVETSYGDLPLVYCHLGDINQVVLNLLVNAAHAIGSADRGRGTIRVSTRIDDDGYAVIEVADTGTGVAPEIADRLFDPFFTTKEVGSGTGQGLAMVRTLVTDRHGGTIDFTSVVGEGTIFTVRLPVDEDGEPAEAADAG